MQEELLQIDELFDALNKGISPNSCHIDCKDLIENINILGYEMDTRKIAQMIEYIN